LCVALLAAVVAAGVLVGGGGWYFADQIRADGLGVDSSAPAYDLTVVQVEAATVTLREAPGHGRDPALRRGELYGLRWPGGSGVLSAVPAVGGNSAVILPLTVRTGRAPGVGTRAELTRDVFNDPASAYHRSVQDVEIACAGGQCPAWYLSGTGTTWVVMVHGKGATRTEPLRALGAVLRARMPALVISYRNDPGAPRDPSGFYRYGASEWRDLDLAVRYALDHGAQHVVLAGFSMGGGIVASFMEHSALTASVTGLVLDAPMLNFRQTVDFGASQRQLPGVGTPIPRPLTWTAETVAGLRFGIDWKRIDYLGGRWLRVPTLLFHGTADKTVPITTSDGLTREHPGLVREVRVPGATHVGAWNADPAGYTATLSAFLRERSAR
jgi:pimeloyl-ACP methyl ester carboxylesterase